MIHGMLTEGRQRGWEAGWNGVENERKVYIKSFASGNLFKAFQVAEEMKDGT